MRVTGFKPMEAMNPYSPWDMDYREGEFIRFTADDPTRRGVLIEIIYSKKGIVKRVVRKDYGGRRTCISKSTILKMGISGNGYCNVSFDNPSFTELYLHKLVQRYGISSVEFLRGRRFYITKGTDIIIPKNSGFVWLGTYLPTYENEYKSVQSTDRPIVISGKDREGTVYLSSVNKFVLLNNYGYRKKEKVLYTLNPTWGMNRYMDWLEDIKSSGLLKDDEVVEC